mmetsp:Transcript_37570/g.68667  ORF Transcript_37570/g.68667 Transcript_37570/m.68667 type:complete len:241 (+) Transcript_37570:37-759(+)
MRGRLEDLLSELPHTIRVPARETQEQDNARERHRRHRCCRSRRRCTGHQRCRSAITHSHIRGNHVFYVVPESEQVTHAYKAELLHEQGCTHALNSHTSSSPCVAWQAPQRHQTHVKWGVLLWRVQCLPPESSHEHAHRVQIDGECEVALETHRWVPALPRHHLRPVVAFVRNEHGHSAAREGTEIGDHAEPAGGECESGVGRESFGISLKHLAERCVRRRCVGVGNGAAYLTAAVCCCAA